MFFFGFPFMHTLAYSASSDNIIFIIRVSIVPAQRGYRGEGGRGEGRRYERVDGDDGRHHYYECTFMGSLL